VGRKPDPGGEIAKQTGKKGVTIGAPVILADGIFGRDLVMVESGPILGRIGVASAVHDAPVMVVLSHCKGHIGAGKALNGHDLEEKSPPASSLPADQAAVRRVPAGQGGEPIKITP